MVIRKLFRAEMAHAVPCAYTKRCRFLHGHSYVFELSLSSKRPRDPSMVVDFQELKDIGIKDFFDGFDHSVVLWKKDPLASLIETINPKRHLLVPFVPTAEMLAKALFLGSSKIVSHFFKSGGKSSSPIEVKRVIVHETATGYASYDADEKKGDRFPDIQFSAWIVSPELRKEWGNKAWVECLFGREP